MANPMQKRSKNAFLLGVIITLVLMGLVAFVLMTKINNLNKEIKAMQAQKTSVYVAALDLKSGEDLTSETITMKSIETTLMPDQIVDSSYIDAIDENGNPIMYKLKIDVPMGAIITTDMVYVEGEGTTKDQRIQEYNMISLPSQVLDGSYIDIRFRLPSGEDYVVLSKKKVEQANSTTIWLKVDETEILTMNNAIIESWMITGSKLYAIEYTEPGMQEKAVSTYPISRETLDYLNNNPNALADAMNALRERYTEGLAAQRNDRINSILNQYMEDRDSLVETGTVAETQSMQEAREEYIKSLGIE